MVPQVGYSSTFHDDRLRITHADPVNPLGLVSEFLRRFRHQVSQDIHRMGVIANHSLHEVSALFSLDCLYRRCGVGRVARGKE